MAHTESERVLLISTIHAFLGILDSRGITIEMPPEDEIEKMDYFELQRLERRLRDVARTPTI